MTDLHPVSLVFWEVIGREREEGNTSPEEVLFVGLSTFLLPCYAYDRDEQQWYAEGKHGWEQVEEQTVMEEAADFVTMELSHSLRCFTEPLYEQMLLAVNRREVLERLFARLKTEGAVSHSETCRYWRKRVCECNGKVWEYHEMIDKNGITFWILPPDEVEAQPASREEGE